MEHSTDNPNEQYSSHDDGYSIASEDTFVPRTFGTGEGSSEGDEVDSSPALEYYLHGQASQDVHFQQDYRNSGAFETEPDGDLFYLEGAEAWENVNFSRDPPFVGPEVGSSSLDLPNNDIAVSAANSISRSGSLSSSTSSFDALSQAELSPPLQQLSFFGEPSQPDLSLKLPCMFEAIKMCRVRYSTAHEIAWIRHIKQHLKDKYPSLCTCPFCPATFPETPPDWPKEIWNGKEWGRGKEKNHTIFEKYLQHMAGHFQEIDCPEGSPWVLDDNILRFLLKHNHITDDERQQYYDFAYTQKNLYGSWGSYFPEPAPQDQYETGSQEEAAEVGGPSNTGNWSERNEHILRKDKGRAKEKEREKGIQKQKEKEKEKGKGKGLDKDKDKDKDKGKNRSKDK